jgi:hypothetical protein
MRANEAAELRIHFTWRVLVGGLPTQTMVSSRPFASIEQSISCALRIASEGVAPEAVAQWTMPLKFMQTSYLFCVCSIEECKRYPTSSIAPTTVMIRICSLRLAIVSLTNVM